MSKMRKMTEIYTKKTIPTMEILLTTEVLQIMEGLPTTVELQITETTPTVQSTQVESQRVKKKRFAQTVINHTENLTPTIMLKVQLHCKITDLRTKKYLLVVVLQLKNHTYGLMDCA